MNSALMNSALRFGMAILTLAITATLAAGHVGWNPDEEFWDDVNRGFNIRVPGRVSALDGRTAQIRGWR